MVGEGDAPVVSVLVASAKARRQSSPSRPPKGTDPGPLRAFSLQSTLFGGPPEGAIIAFVAPRASRCRARGRRPCPVVAVLVPAVRQSSPLLPPKGTDPGPMRAFSLQTTRFQGTAERAMIPHRGPPGKPTPGDAPVVAVLLAAERQTSAWLPKGRESSPLAVLPANHSFLGGQEWGP
jgi:hypothetical protein